MIVELISVGTELLLGNIVNTNAQYLSETCAKLGLNVYYQTTVGDNRERMTEVFRTALSRARNAPESARSVLCRSKVRKWKLLCSHSAAPRISALPVSRSMAGHPLRKNVHRRSSR